MAREIFTESEGNYKNPSQDNQYLAEIWTSKLSDIRVKQQY